MKAASPCYFMCPDKSFSDGEQLRKSRGISTTRAVPAMPVANYTVLAASIPGARKTLENEYLVCVEFPHGVSSVCHGAVCVFSKENNEGKGETSEKQPTSLDPDGLPAEMPDPWFASGVTAAEPPLSRSGHERQDEMIIALLL